MATRKRSRCDRPVKARELAELESRVAQVEDRTARAAEVATDRRRILTALGLPHYWTDEELHAVLEAARANARKGRTP